MKNVIIDYRASCIDALLDLGFNVIKTPHINSVYSAICGHTDIILCKLSDRECVVEPTVFEYFSKFIGSAVIGETNLSDKYPADIAYNAARVGNCLFCLEKYTDRAILEYCDKNNIKIINTKQGYSKCSICIVDDNAIITSDKNIFNLAERNNIDVLFVNDKNVMLEGFEHGFFGGATGLLDKSLFVNGNIERHFNANAIIDFCNKRNVKVISLSEEAITDVGSIVFLESNSEL